MPESITCTNPQCGATIPAEGKEVGEMVQCPKCGSESPVVVRFVDDFELDDAAPSTPATEKGHIHHPARQQCPNCGAVLGVRDALCKKCGADIRTGAVAKVVVREKKFPLKPVLIGSGAALVIIVVVLVMILTGGD